MEANEHLADERSSRQRTPRPRFRWKTAGIVLVASIGAVWLLRVPLMNLAIRGYLDAKGIDAEVVGEEFGLAKVKLKDLRVGKRGAPDLTAQKAEVLLKWNGFAPSVRSVSLDEPVLNARLDRTGISLGSLDQFIPAGSNKPFSLPQVEMNVRQGRVYVTTPYGVVAGHVETSGRVDRDFDLKLRAHSIAVPGQPDELEELILVAAASNGPDGLAARIEGGAASINIAGLFPGLRSGAFRFEGEVHGQYDFSRLSGFLKGNAERVLKSDDTGASEVEFTVNLDDLHLSKQMVPTDWDGTARITAAAARAGELTIQKPDVNVVFTGTNGTGTGQWTATAGAFEGPGLRIRSTTAGGQLEAELKDGPALIGASGALRLRDGAIKPEQRARLRRALASLSSTPLEGLASHSARALDAALQNFSAATRFNVTWRQGFGEIIVPGAVEVAGRGGVRFSLVETDERLARVELPSGNTVVSGRASLSGPGLPKLEARIDRLTAAPGAPIESAGTVVVDDWQAGGSRLSLTPVTYKLTQGEGKGEVLLSGRAKMSGPIPGGRIEDLQLPLDLEAAWGNGLRLAASEGCLNVRIGGLQIGEQRFGQGAMPVCPRGDKGFLWTAPDGTLTGGATAETLKLALLQENGAPTGKTYGLSAGPVLAAVSGTTDKPVLGLELRQAALRLPGGITANSRRIMGQLRGGGAAWRGNGTIEGLQLAAAEAGVRAEARGRWLADFANEAAPLQLAALTGQLTDTGKQPRFEPLSFTDGTARVGGKLALMSGKVRLASSGEVLGEAQARHMMETGSGEATLNMTGLTFTPTLQPYLLSEMARGVVENVTGSIGGFVRARWSEGGGLQTEGQFDLNNLSMATGGLGPIEGVNGQVRVTDFLEMTTPPGQTVRIAKLNPGVAMENGVISFQMLPGHQLKVEEASWPLADGRLLVEPTTVDMDENEKRVTLQVDSVDLEKFIGLMEMESLRATGEIEGELPLVITREGASIEKGYLRTKGEGTLSYTGPVPATEGNAKLAFDALKNFKFNSITLDVEGDLAGEIHTGIRFDGTSVASLSPVSWFRALKARGIPFKFNVNVKAPLRSLMSSISGVSDVGEMVRRTVEMELEKTGEDNANAQAEPEGQ